MIKSLQSLRGISAILIVAHHFGFSSGIVESFGDFAVAVFMMLSGFVLTLAYQGRLSGGQEIPFSYFMLKRVARIVPLYLLGQIYIVLFSRFHVSGVKTILDLLMLQSWIPSADYYFSGNAPSWFISDLMLCYLLFIPAITLLYRRPRIFAYVFLTYLAAYFSCVVLLPYELVHPIVYIFPPMQFPVFVLGMMLAKLFDSQHSVISARASNVFIIGLLILTLGQMWLYPSVTTRLSYSSYWWIITALWIVALTMSDNLHSAMIRLFHLPLMIRLGDVSYAVFIFHIPFLYTWQVICKHLGVKIPLLADFIIFTLLTVVVATCIHRLIEIPLTRRLDAAVNKFYTFKK